MIKHTPGRWTNGWGKGVTGPTTPSVGGVTCSESLAYSKWKEGNGKYPKDEYTIVSRGYDTIAIIPTLTDPLSDIKQEEGRANARLIASAPELLEALVNLSFEMDFMLRNNPKKKGGLYELRLKEAREVIAKAEGEK